MRKTNRRHMTGDDHGRTAGRATLLLTATDGILGTHNTADHHVLLLRRVHRCSSQAGQTSRTPHPGSVPEPPGNRQRPQPAAPRPSGAVALRDAPIAVKVHAGSADPVCQPSPVGWASMSHKDPFCRADEPVLPRPVSGGSPADLRVDPISAFRRSVVPASATAIMPGRIRCVNPRWSGAGPALLANAAPSRRCAEPHWVLVGQVPRKTGGRFSAKALRPSR